MSNVKVIDLVKEGYRLPAPPQIPKTVVLIMQSCWDANPEKRPSIETISQGLTNSKPAPFKHSSYIERTSTVSADHYITQDAELDELLQSRHEIDKLKKEIEHLKSQLSRNSSLPLLNLSIEHSD